MFNICDVWTGTFTNNPDKSQLVCSWSAFFNNKCVKCNNSKNLKGTEHTHTYVSINISSLFQAVSNTIGVKKVVYKAVYLDDFLL